MIALLLRRLGCSAGLLAAMLSVGQAWAQNVVNVMNARHYGTDEQLWAGFEKATGIKVNEVEGDHDALLQRMKAEGRRSPADVFITVDAGRLAFAADNDLLQPLASPVIESRIPAHLRHPEGLWFGLAVRARILAYAKDKVRPESLSTYEALADPKLKGQILIRSSSNIYNLGLVGSLIEADGMEATLAWCKGLVANFARKPEGGDGDQLKAAAMGIGDIAISNTYYLARLAGSDKPEDRAIADKLGVFFPNQQDRGTHVNISGAGLAKHAPNRDHAIKLIEYLTDEPAQRYFADVSFEYPANPTVKPHPVLVAWGDFKQDTVNAAKFAKRNVDALKLVDNCGWR